MRDIVSTHCKKVLAGVTAHKWCWPFLAPVDVAVYRDYRDRIARPMDFGAVRASLEGGAYAHPDAFVADVRLVFNNARAYNPPGSDVHVMADTLLERFDEKYVAYVVPRIADAEAASRREEEAARRELLGPAPAALGGGAGPAAEAALLRRLDAAAAAIADAKSAAAAACPTMPRAEKEALCDALGTLSQPGFEAALGLVLHRCPGLQPADGIGFDLAALDALTLRQLASFVRAAGRGAGEGATPVWPDVGIGAGVPPRKARHGGAGAGAALPGTPGGEAAAPAATGAGAAAPADAAARDGQAPATSCEPATTGVSTDVAGGGPRTL
ncbi:Transcription factor GTE1 [Auxenochlorella protothecoides]|uniref:Transcription factor GTE1 n=1 Tax=Auxenochlorella protothecoides TaxID=3075 RepID=A0A087SGY1_AUXPR|nr:Transcription factor GTE1 [Auxenochlorella protothecoides]KFM24985.1 Transcription factor GTE1 [Auxenochlorella protothecoides]